ncbi:hypothetical protein DL769_007837 [Monosporascus sp. CRB-8-3]|nr:hypothetical protein DL769_007837 [Monosporascus sp. CRB-8-3]
MPTYSVDGDDSDENPGIFRDPRMPSNLRGGQPATPDSRPSRLILTPRSPAATTGARPSPASRVGNTASPASVTVTPPVSRFLFGQGAGDFTFTASGTGTISFRSLHNVSPSPSPRPIARPSPRVSREASPAPSCQLTPPEAELSRLTLNGASSVHQRHAESPQPPAAHSGSPMPSGTWLSPPQAEFSRLTLTESPSTAKVPVDGASPSRATQDRTPPAVASYNVRDEQVPNHPFFTSSFQTALKDGLDIAKGITNMIQSIPDSIERGPEIHRLLEDAKVLSSFVGSDTRTIAVLGDSGQGKSSLINSLLHFPDIAKTGDTGSACTSVVTEYRQKTKEHSAAPIAIEVEYLPKADIAEMVRELLWSYRQLFLPGVESDNTPAADYARYTRESEQAWSALEAAFQHQSRFSKEMLRDMSEGALERIQDQLIAWTNDMEWPDGGEAGCWKSTANNAEECREKTGLFMQDRYWPFTKIIRVYLNAQVLKTGVVLADLPGLQDTNLARVRGTERYLLKCDNILLVASIARAITDQSLKSSLYNVLSRHIPLSWEESGGKGLNVAVDINLRAARAEFCGPGKRIPNDTMDQLDKDLAAAKDAHDKARKKQLKRQQWLLIEARNEHVKDGLRKAYAAKVPGKELDVFCVSNTTYEKYSEKGDEELVRASGIPQLRQFCHSITAEAQFREALDQLQARLPNLINSLELWANTSLAAHEREDFVLDVCVYRIRTDVEKERRDIWHGKRQLLARGNAGLTGIGASRPQAKACMSRTNRVIVQYYAWCLNNGDHATPSRSREDWNAKIIWKMRMELDYQWDLVEDEIPSLFESLLDTIKSELGYLKDQIGSKSALERTQIESSPSLYAADSARSDVSKALNEGIDSRIKGLEYALGLEKERFASAVRLVRRNASESNYSSFILKEMIPAYREASSQRGSGRDKRQKQIVQNRITDGTLFPNMSIAITQGIESAVKKLEKALRDILEQSMSNIRNDFDLTIAPPPKATGTSGGGRRDGDRTGLVKQRETLVGQAKLFKERHAGLLESIASLCDIRNNLDATIAPPSRTTGTSRGGRRVEDRAGLTKQRQDLVDQENPFEEHHADLLKGDVPLK